MTRPRGKGRRPSRYRDITVSLTRAQYAYLKHEASTRTTSISQLIREVLHEALPPLMEPGVEQ